MSRRTIIREYPEVVRGERGLTLRVLGQTFEPRPGTVSARALEDAALDEQIEMAGDDYAVVLTIDGHSTHPQMYRSLGESVIEVSARRVFVVGGRLADLHVRVLVESPKLSVLSAVLTRRGEYTTSDVGRDGLGDDMLTRLSAALDEVRDFLATSIPEVRARTSERPPSRHVANAVVIEAVPRVSRPIHEVEVGDLLALEGDEYLEVTSRSSSGRKDVVVTGLVGGAVRRIRKHADSCVDFVYFD